MIELLFLKDKYYMERERETLKKLERKQSLGKGWPFASPREAGTRNGWVTGNGRDVLETTWEGIKYLECPLILLHVEHIDTAIVSSRIKARKEQLRNKYKPSITQKSKQGMEWCVSVKCFEYNTVRVPGIFADRKNKNPQEQSQTQKTWVQADAMADTT